MKSLVNNITALNQQVYINNKTNIESKPYKSFLKKDMYLFDAIIRQVQSGKLSPEKITPPTPIGFNTMLSTDLWKSTGYAVLEDGTLYSASCTKFPDCTPEMFEWWFWWHSVESERYALWYPYCHVSVEAKNKDVLENSTVSHREKYIGNTHKITEYLNDVKNDIEITFVEPEEFGFDKNVLENASIRASACGYVYSQKPRIRVCKMIHLFKETPEGGELISRYYIGDNMSASFGDIDIKIPDFIKNKALKSDTSGIQTAYEQVMHDQIEFTHLASFLPELYRQFGTN